MLLYKEYKKNVQQYNNKIALINSNLSEVMYTDSLQTLLNLKTAYQNELKELKAPLIVSSYFGNRSVYYTFAAYIFLGILVFILLPVRSDIKSSLTILFTLIIYSGWMMTSWLRNFILFDEGRTIFSYVNFDISPISFFLQELRTLGMAFLIALLWRGWILYKMRQPKPLPDGTKATLCRN